MSKVIVITRVLKSHGKPVVSKVVAIPEDLPDNEVDDFAKLETEHDKAMISGQFVEFKDAVFDYTIHDLVHTH